MGPVRSQTGAKRPVHLAGNYGRRRKGLLELAPPRDAGRLRRELLGIRTDNLLIHADSIDRPRGDAPASLGHARGLRPQRHNGERAQRRNSRCLRWRYERPAWRLRKLRAPIRSRGLIVTAPIWNRRQAPNSDRCCEHEGCQACHGGAPLDESSAARTRAQRG